VGSSHAANRTITPHTIEMSVLGFIGDSFNFCLSLNLPLLPLDVKEVIIRPIISSSFDIYCNRNSSPHTNIE